MQPIGKFSIRRHDSDGSAGWLGAENEDFLLFRVVGRSDAKVPRVGQLLREQGRAEASVALTLEGVEAVTERHIAVCSEVAEVCRRQRRRLLICGAGRDALLRLTSAGVLEYARKESVFADLAAMVASLTRVDPRGQPRPGRPAVGR